MRGQRWLPSGSVDSGKGIFDDDDRWCRPCAQLFNRVIARLNNCSTTVPRLRCLRCKVSASVSKMADDLDMDVEELCEDYPRSSTSNALHALEVSGQRMRDSIRKPSLCRRKMTPFF